MIYRVGDNEISTYDYGSMKAVQTAESGEKFSLDRNKEEKTASEKKKADDGSDKQEALKAGTAQKGGVKLELSGKNGSVASNSGKSAGQAADGESVSIFQSISGLFAKFVEAVKKAFDKIWNDPPTVADQETGEEVLETERERLTEEYRKEKGIEEASGQTYAAKTDEQRDKEIRQYLHKGNLEQVLSILTDDGRRTIARNSNLLTYYDKNGRIAQINASDRERILHGDRNVTKL